MSRDSCCLAVEADSCLLCPETAGEGEGGGGGADAAAAGRAAAGAGRVAALPDAASAGLAGGREEPGGGTAAAGDGEGCAGEGPRAAGPTQRRDGSSAKGRITQPVCCRDKVAVTGSPLSEPLELVVMNWGRLGVKGKNVQIFQALKIVLLMFMQQKY